MIIDKKRIDFIDIAKGIGIFLVVIGHTGLKDFPSDWIWSFHMPLFFFLSGVFFNIKKYNTFIILFKRKARVLIVPYIVFSVIAYLGFYTLDKGQSHSTKELLLGWEGIALWFVPILFFTEFLFYGLNMINKKRIFICLCLILFSAVGYYLKKHEIYFIYKLEVVFSSIVFFGLGAISNNYVLNRIISLSRRKLLLFAIFCLMLNLLMVFINRPRLDLAWNQIGEIIPGYLGAIFGIFFILYISILISCVFKRVKFVVVFLGENTFVILALHQLYSVYIRRYFECADLSSAIDLPVRHLLLWALLVLTIYLLNRYIPFFLHPETLKK